MPTNISPGLQIITLKEARNNHLLALLKSSLRNSRAVSVPMCGKLERSGIRFVHELVAKTPDEVASLLGTKLKQANIINKHISQTIGLRLNTTFSRELKEALGLPVTENDSSESA